MKTTLIGFIGLCALAAFGCGDSTLIIANDALSTVILEIKLAPSRSGNWGNNLLESSLLDPIDAGLRHIQYPDDPYLLPGERLEVRGVACAIYDVHILFDTVSFDEEGTLGGAYTECTLHDFKLCFDNAVWEINLEDEKFLQRLDCESF